MRRINFLENPQVHKRGGPWSHEARHFAAIRAAFRKWAAIYWPEALR